MATITPAKASQANYLQIEKQAFKWENDTNHGHQFFFPDGVQQRLAQIDIYLSENYNIYIHSFQILNLHRIFFVALVEVVPLYSKSIILELEFLNDLPWGTCRH